MIEYDIDLSNLSKKGKKNFHKYIKTITYKKAMQELSFIEFIFWSSLLILIISSKLRKYREPKFFINNFSSNGVFSYCFECNKKIIPNSNNCCPRCNASSQFSLLKISYHRFGGAFQYYIKNIVKIFFFLSFIIAFGITCYYFVKS
ncbi:hypothetical protein AAEX28_13100 [Lentisphaerota bacterium WC36G]|nr:hypothetical protein LJT99_15930 [Lentisphaerae bacterium WC36]